MNHISIPEKKEKWNIERESKVLQYFGIDRNDFAFPDAFNEVQNVMNNTEQRDADFGWYSKNVTRRICHYSLEHSQGIPSFDYPNLVSLSKLWGLK